MSTSSRISVRARSEAIARAKTAMAALEANPKIGIQTLGRGRDALNTVWNTGDAAVVLAAVQRLEAMAEAKGGKA